MAIDLDNSKKNKYDTVKDRFDRVLTVGTPVIVVGTKSYGPDGLLKGVIAEESENTFTIHLDNFKYYSRQVRKSKVEFKLINAKPLINGTDNN